MNFSLAPEPPGVLVGMIVIYVEVFGLGRNEGLGRYEGIWGCGLFSW